MVAVFVDVEDEDVPEEAMANFGTVWRSFLALFKLTLGPRGPT